MKFELPPLPYAMDALAPHLSARTLEFHYDRHHRGYLAKLHGLIDGTPEAQMELVDLVTKATGATFNNAAQVWNHTFYWESLSPDGGGAPKGRVAEAISGSFGSIASFRERFAETALNLFGSGYVWLSFDPATERLLIEGSKDAGNPLQLERIPLLGLDVWEHAYYLDYQNARNGYVGAFLERLVNWHFAEQNLEKASSA